MYEPWTWEELRTATENDIKEVVRFHERANPVGENGEGDFYTTDMLCWYFIPDYDLTRLRHWQAPGENGTWEEWWAEEIENNDRETEDGSPSLYYEDLEQWYLAHPEQEPLVVVEYGGRGYLWDGFHRLAVNHIHGRTKAPVFLGQYVELETVPLY